MQKNFLFTEEEFRNAKSRELLPLQCVVCQTEFRKEKRVLKRKEPHLYCSSKCYQREKNPKISFLCEFCKRPANQRKSAFLDKRIKNHFCSQSCAASFNNSHKTIGNRRSKLEIWLENRLVETFPNIIFFFNEKSAIDSELDIYIPSLKLAFELNGIFHYEPIFGAEKLSQIKNNDHRKYQACLEHGIDLCIIDISGQKKFTEYSSQKYFDIINAIILARNVGDDPTEASFGDSLVQPTHFPYKTKN